MKSDLDEVYVPVYTKKRHEDMPKPREITCWDDMAGMSQEDCRAWLIIYDAEAEDYWRSLPDDTDFREAVCDNIIDFGFQND